MKAIFNYCSHIFVKKRSRSKDIINCLAIRKKIGRELYRLPRNNWEVMGIQMEEEIVNFYWYLSSWEFN